MSMIVPLALLYIFLFQVIVDPAAAVCFHPGPAYPRPTIQSDNHGLVTVTAKLSSLIIDILSHNFHSSPAFDTDITSFSIQLTSNAAKLWEYHHTAPVLGSYQDSNPSPVNADTAFRIASISKTFTVYALLLQEGVSLDTPITKYVSELSGSHSIARINWDAVTLWSLASHLSGVARDYGLKDIAVDRAEAPNALTEGFPNVADQDLPICGGTITDKACDRDQFLRGLLGRSAVSSVNERSTYSNLAFTLLGVALSNITGKSFEESILQSITRPLKMEKTRISKPKDSDGVIPAMPNIWGLERGVGAASGGVYSTTNDLSIYIRSILNAQLLPIGKINEWLKPRSFSPGLNSAYGAPWEILRTTRLSVDKRAIDIFTKEGRNPGYSSMIIIVPEYNIGLTILTAGDPAALFTLQEILATTIIRDIEAVLRDEMEEKYSGIYLSSSIESSLTLEVDSTGPGLKVSSWISNGTDFLPIYGRLRGISENWTARLLPTDLKPSSQEEVWRLQIVNEPSTENGGVFDDLCVNDVDRVLYGNKPIEEFIFRTDVNGAVINVALSGLRVDLKKQGETGRMTYTDAEDWGSYIKGWVRSRLEDKRLELDRQTEREEMQRKKNAKLMGWEQL